MPTLEPRVYTIGPPLTEEQTAVTFAMTSRSPQPFDEIASQVSETQAAEFHEKWVIGYGHASVSEHAVIHLALENISRLAADAVEENRLSSYTEKSSRYQLIAPHSFHVPREVCSNPDLQRRYTSAMESLFRIYLETEAALTPQVLRQLRSQAHPEKPPTRTDARRIVIDQVRAVLPAATLTNVGMTANARNMEHALAKLLSDPLTERQDLAKTAKTACLQQTPTLLNYAQPNQALARHRARPVAPPSRSALPPSSAFIIDHAPASPETAIAAAICRDQNTDPVTAHLQHGALPKSENLAIIAHYCTRNNEHDPLPRELELANYTTAISIDYGALRELRRHRMMTPVSQILTTVHGFEIPELFTNHNIEHHFQQAMEISEDLYSELYRALGAATAQYAVTHGHQQQILIHLNLRQIAELLRLRTSNRAHDSIRRPIASLRDQAALLHPELLRIVQSLS